MPLVSGTSFIKWHLPHSTAAEHRGRTEKRPIKDHKVVYDYENTIPVRLTVDKNGMLQESWVEFEVLQEYSAGGRGERIVLGNVKLNLAEYVEQSELSTGLNGEEPGIMRRYLMQDSKINSTLKIGIYMRQTEGDKNFIAPPLRTAQVFSGIAGIVSGEQRDPEEAGSKFFVTICYRRLFANCSTAMQSLNTKSRETGELQDMYRRTLAAYWSAQPGELKADECIEDIFAGGDGWGDREQPYNHQQQRGIRFHPDGGGSGSEGEARHIRGGSTHRKSHETLRPGDVIAKSPSGHGGRGRGSLEQQAHQMKAEAERKRHRPYYEVDEFELREDLRSWQLPS